MRSLKLWRERARLRHLARRGDAVLGAQAFWDGILYLARELIPEDDREISRDLFSLLAYAWGAVAEKRRPYDPFVVLRALRERAWLGYADTPALIAQIRRDLPRAAAATRMADYFEELVAKRSTYLFLPIVSRIDRHQLGPLPRHLELDRTMAEFHHASLATVVRQIFVFAPSLARERDLFFHALLTLHWGTGLERQIGPQELAAMVAHQLRRLYEQPDQALAAIRADAASHGAAARALAILQEVGATRNRPLLLEALFIAENIITGPQNFQHAFEVEERFG
jgi:hypothetical protein